MTVVIAHRGARSAHPPGNTLEAFAAAGPLGATWVELDVRRTLDGALAVIHDPQLPDGRLLCQTDSADLPEWVPTLDQALDACAGLGVNVEIKNIRFDPDFDDTEDVSASVALLLVGRSPPQPFVVSSFGLSAIDRVRSEAANLPTALLTIEPTPRSITIAVERGHTHYHPIDGGTTQSIVAAAKDAGLTVNVWTVNEPGRMAELAAWGVDGIITDVPDVAAQVLA